MKFKIWQSFFMQFFFNNEHQRNGATDFIIVAYKYSLQTNYLYLKSSKTIRGSWLVCKGLMSMEDNMSVNLQPDLFNQEIVQEKNGELLVGSDTVAENVEYEHRAVIQLIRQNIQDLEEFGRVAFQMQPFATNGGTQNKEVALLNENQSMLIITYLRNNDITKRFKINLIKAFSIMKNKLLQKQLPTPLETARMLVQVLEEKEALFLTNKVLEKQNTILMHTNNTYTATELAKELGFKSATILNQKLADMKIQYKVNNSWVFYSKYADMGVTSIKQHILENGKEIYDRKFTQSGRDFILKIFESESK